MLCRFSYLAVVAMLQLAAGVSAREPLFGNGGGQAWDEARDIFYVRRFSANEVFDNPHSFGPPYREYQPFFHDTAFYDQTVARLEAMQKLPAAQMEEQPAMRRLILLRDLWAVFDGFLQGRLAIKGDDAATAAATVRRDDLLRRVARVMRRLELSEAEVRALPNAITAAGDKRAAAKEFDLSAPATPFFPSDLLDPAGPWVAYSRESAPSVGGKHHVEFMRHRSIFTLHLRTPGGRDEATKFIANFRGNDAKAPLPAGLTLALLRRAVVPTREGVLAPSPFVESLQLIGVTSAEDTRFQYSLERKDLLAGKPSLKLLDKEDRVDNSGLESGVSVPRIATVTAWNSIPPTESLVLEHYKTVAEMPKALSVCASCHGYATRIRLFACDALTTAYPQSEPIAADATVVSKKTDSNEWKLYLRLRDLQDN